MWKTSARVEIFKTVYFSVHDAKQAPTFTSWLCLLSVCADICKYVIMNYFSLCIFPRTRGPDLKVKIDAAL